MLDNSSNPHPGWTEVREVYIVVGEEEVQVARAEVEWEDVVDRQEVTMGRRGGGWSHQQGHTRKGMGRSVRAMKGGRG